MRIPTEAELIEMERRAAILPQVVGKMERKAAMERNRPLGDNRKAYRLEGRSQSLRRLALDVEALIEIVRSGVLSRG